MFSRKTEELAVVNVNFPTQISYRKARSSVKILFLKIIKLVNEHKYSLRREEKIKPECNIRK